MGTLVRLYLRFFRGAFLYVFVPFMALGLPVLAIYGAVSPFEGDRTAISRQMTGVPVLVGVGAGSEGCRQAAAPCTPRNRTYLVFPHVFSNAGVIVVDQFLDSTKVEVLPGFGLVITGIWALCVWLLWRLVKGEARGRA